MLRDAWGFPGNLGISNLLLQSLSISTLLWEHFKCSEGAAGGSQSTPRRVQLELGCDYGGLVWAQVFVRAHGCLLLYFPSPSPRGVGLWAVLSHVVQFCTEHLDVQVIPGLISSPLDLFSFRKGDPALFSLFISLLPSLRKHWEWGGGDFG